MLFEAETRFYKSESELDRETGPFLMLRTFGRQTGEAKDGEIEHYHKDKGTDELSLVFGRFAGERINFRTVDRYIMKNNWENNRKAIMHRYKEVPA